MLPGSDKKKDPDKGMKACDKYKQVPQGPSGRRRKTCAELLFTTALEVAAVSMQHAKRDTALKQEPYGLSANHYSSCKMVLEDGSYSSSHKKLQDLNQKNQELEMTIAVLEKSVKSPSVVDMEACGWTRGNCIGRGSHGNVYLSVNNRTGELLVAKQITVSTGGGVGNTDRELIMSFKREVKLLSKLKHPNVVKYIGSNVKGSLMTIFQEYVPGGSLSDLLKVFGAFKEPVIKRYSKQILQGLAYLHSQNVVHRDIKGPNILVDQLGTAKIADFGSAKMVKDFQKSVGGAHGTGVAAHGTPYWLAPEVLKGNASERASDVWSAGCVMIEMADGYPPYYHYKDNTMAGIVWKISREKEPPKFPPHLSDKAKEVLFNSLRYQHMERMTAKALLTLAWFSPVTKSSLSMLEDEQVLNAANATILSDDLETEYNEMNKSVTTNPSNLSMIPTLRKGPAIAARLKISPSASSFLTASSVDSMAHLQPKMLFEKNVVPDNEATIPAPEEEATSFDEEGNQLCLSMPTLHFALTWLSMIREVLPLETYVMMAEGWEGSEGEYEEDTEYHSSETGSTWPSPSIKSTKAHDSANSLVPLVNNQSTISFSLANTGRQRGDSLKSDRGRNDSFNSRRPLSTRIHRVDTRTHLEESGHGNSPVSRGPCGCEGACTCTLKSAVSESFSETVNCGQSGQSRVTPLKRLSPGLRPLIKSLGASPSKLGSGAGTPEHRGMSPTTPGSASHLDVVMYRPHQPEGPGVSTPTSLEAAKNAPVLDVWDLSQEERPGFKQLQSPKTAF